MEQRDVTPFRIAKYFEEHVPRMLASLSEDPDGMYQVVYRVGQVMISAQVWRESPELEVSPQYSVFDQEFLKALKISTNADEAV